jgi:hypothetical protein
VASIDGNDHAWVVQFAPNGGIVELCGARTETCSTTMTYLWRHLERFDCFPILVVPVAVAARSSLATADAASFVVLPRLCASRIASTFLSECPVMVAISGTSRPASAGRVTADAS